MSPIETFTFAKEVKLVDAEGRPIREGSVLREINDGERGVVTRVVRAGGYGGPCAQLGDVFIATAPGCARVTNRYNQWRHVPHSEQTYEERYVSWLHTPPDPDRDSRIPVEEQIACAGIMALLPEGMVNADRGPWPDTIEVALRYLAQHLTDVTASKQNNQQ